MSAKLKQQITDLLLGNNDILKLIAEAVSSLIVDKFTNSEETIGQIAENIIKKPDFIKAVKMSTTEQESMKQEMYESLSFDYQRLQEKQEQEGICRKLSARNKDLAWELDSQEQYGRRNCLLFHGVAEMPLGMRRRENTDAAQLSLI